MGQEAVTAAISFVAAILVAIGVIGCVCAWGFTVFQWFAGAGALFTGKPRGKHRLRFFLGGAAFVVFWGLGFLGGYLGNQFGGWGNQGWGNH